MHQAEDNKDGGATAWGSALDDVDEAAAGGGGGGKKSKSQKAPAGKGKKSKGRAEQEDSEDEEADSDAEGGEEVEAAGGESDEGAPEEEEEERASGGAGKRRKMADAASKVSFVSFVGSGGGQCREKHWLGAMVPECRVFEALKIEGVSFLVLVSSLSCFG